MKLKEALLNFCKGIGVGAVILFGGCDGIQTTKTVEKQADTISTFTLPEGAVPIVYVNHIHIPSDVDSISENFVFDTGADGLYFDSTFFATNTFREFKFLKGVLPGAGSGNPQQVIIITDTVNFKFKNYNNYFSFIPVFLLKPIVGDFADGILGNKYFSNQVLEINYFREYIRLHDDISTIDTSEYVKINMKKEGDRLYVPATIHINDTVSIQDYLELDTGSAGSISIPSGTANKYNLSENIANKVAYYTKYGGIRGHSSSFDFRAYSVELGDYQLDGMVMEYSKDTKGSLAVSNHAGLLGNKILDRFDVVIDFVNNDLYLKPNPNFNKPSTFSKRGFTYVDRNATMNAWIVTGLYNGSNAEIAGLEIDDKITSVNGIDIHQIPFKEQSEFWEKQDQVVLIVLRNGVEKRIEFDLKYVL